MYYIGQVIDTADRGPSPKPWDVLVMPPNPYKVKLFTANDNNFIYTRQVDIFRRGK